ncbi:IS110 family transposase, partial [Pseudoalteromonas sp. MB41]|nr:IS110 family transposase [Pseudoalteromonas sp. MB41]MCC9662353.1 IS110 family transposase [Pseudoalteromonas sp. MB41]
MTQSSTITIDLAKTVFQVAFFNKFGVLKSNEKMTERKMLSFIVNHPEAIICMEACSSAHYYGRKFEGQGHKVKL